MNEFDLGDILSVHVTVMGRLGRWAGSLRDEAAIRLILLDVYAARDANVDIIRQGAILAVSLVQTHPFFDGNVPTAFGALDTFLDLSGLRFRMGSERITTQYLRVVAEEHEREVAVQLFETRLRSVIVAADLTES